METPLSDARTFYADTLKHITDIVEQVEQAVADAVAFGQERMVDYIESRGTGRTWAREYEKDGIKRSASVPGRVWTGAMRDAVSQELDRAGFGNMKGRFGWLQTQDNYFLEQEHGFMSGSIPVPAMHALYDAREDAIEYLRVALGRIK